MRDAMIMRAGPEAVARYAAAKGLTPEKAREWLDAMREAVVNARRENPFENGYEPPIWYVAKALIRNPAWSESERMHIKKRLGKAWDAEIFAAKMREALGFANPVTKLLIMGSNRSGKTDFAMKLCMQTALEGGKRICSGAQTLPTQKKNQMPRLWHYMPKELKAKNIATQKAKDAVENISYTEKNGFAGRRITFANKSIIDFISYEQTTNSLEGVEYDLAHLDEEYGIGHYNLMTTRITSRAGCFVGTFTPLNGYTPTVAAFLDGMEVVKWHEAALRPRDGGEMEPWRELGLEREEYEELVEWRRSGMQGECDVPESRPEDCFGWVLGKDGGDPPNPPMDARPSSPPNPPMDAYSRIWDRVPRVAKCQGGQAAAIWFYGSDNPYGLPSELIIAKMANRNAEAAIYSSVYGMAAKQRGAIFGMFSEERNTFRPEELPEELVRIMVLDPAPERNWCMGWYGYDPRTGILYKYREWPGNYEIEGVGVPGEWAVISDKNMGRNDGARGPAQESFGFGYMQYKREIARLEGWDEDEDEAAEPMAWRLIDSRAAMQSKVSAGGSRTLIEDLEEYMGGWQVADGQKTAVGYSRMIDKIAAGKYKISTECVNTLGCYRLLTGADGQKGAAKDMIDCDRYAVMSDIWNCGEEMAISTGQAQLGHLHWAISTGERTGEMARTPQRKKMPQIWW